MQSFGGPFHSKLTLAGTGLIEACNRRKCALVICSLKLSTLLVRFPTYVTGSSLAEIVEVANTRIQN